MRTKGPLLLVLAGLLLLPRSGEPTRAAVSPGPTAPDPVVGEAWSDVAAFVATHEPKAEGNDRVWEYELVVTETEIKLVDGTRYKVWAFGNRVPGPLLVAREGDRVRIRLVNETSIGHTIHSHGLYVPHRMDGVPHALAHAGMEGMPPWAQPVQPGESFTYEFIARPAGTHFYHCHMNTNEHLDRGMAGPLVVLPREPDPEVDRDVLLVLDEWNSTYAQEGVPGQPTAIGSYDFFTLNGRSFPDTQILVLAPGDIARLRLVHAGTVPHYMHLHGHSFLVTHRDGAPLAEPVILDTVDIGPGQRIDLLIVAENPGMWPFHCHATPHVTNAGVYPGGMLTRIQVGADPFPAVGEGTAGKGLEAVRRRWRDRLTGIEAIPKSPERKESER